MFGCFTLKKEKKKRSFGAINGFVARCEGKGFDPVRDARPVTSSAPR